MDHNMYNGTIGGPVLNEEGAVHSGRGKYRLQFLGSDNPKEITKRVVLGAVAVVLAVIVAVFCLAGKQPKDFPDVTVLRNAIATPLEEAALKVGVKLTDMTETEPGVFFSGKSIKLDGVKFDLYFYEENGMCSGFAYKAEYQAKPGKAARDIYNILVDMRIKEFAPNGETEEVQVTLKSIQKELEKETAVRINGGYNWDIYESDPIKVFMNELEQNGWGQAVFFVNKGIFYDPKTQTVQMLFQNRIEEIMN